MPVASRPVALKTHGAQPLILLAGPTASGKTSLAIELAEALDGDGPSGEIVSCEIVSCDSVSVYRGLEIGSAKPTAVQRQRVPHHGLDLFSVDQPCTAGDWARAARTAIAAITARGHLPIVVGGSGLYFRALVEGLHAAPRRDAELRTRLEASARRHGGGLWLHRLLRRLDPAAAHDVHTNDVPKLVRVLELRLNAAATVTAQRAEAAPDALAGYRVLELALGPDRKALYRRIDARVEQMFADGLIDETRGLVARFGEAAFPLRALGYAQAAAMLRGDMTAAAAIERAQAGHRQYAKRQLTWFRNQRRMRWLAGFGGDAAVVTEAVAAVRQFLMQEATPHH